MASDKQEYKLTVVGPGHNFEGKIDETVASQIISLAMTGKFSVASEPTPLVYQESSSSAASIGSATAQGRGSLASYIKSKKADKSQARRFLVTAHWLAGRTTTLSASGVAKALLDNHQKR